MTEEDKKTIMAGQHVSSVTAEAVPLTASSTTQQPESKSERPPIVVTPAEVEAIKQSSPFLDTSYPMTAYEWFKMILLLPWTLFKLPVALLGFILVWGITKLMIMGSPIHEPHAPWRSKFTRNFLSFWSDILMRPGFSFWRLPIRGRDNITAAEEARAIIVFNHVSYMDPYVLVKVFAPCGLAKIGVVKLPFLGDLTRALQFLFIQRKGTEDKANKLAIQGGHTTEKIAERAADKRYPLFMIAPEATTKSAQCLLKFSSGAFATQRPVLPVLLHYRAKHFHPGWGSITSTLFHMFRMLSQFANHLEVEILPVYVPDAKEKADPKLYAENVRVLMAKKLGVPLADAGILDHIRLKHAGLYVDNSGGRIIQTEKGRKNVERSSSSTSRPAAASSSS